MHRAMYIICNYIDQSITYYDYVYVALDTPLKADFLFVHSSTDGYATYSHGKTGFITKLVDAFVKNLNENHLEDVLLIVKKEVAKIKYQVKDGHTFKTFKQMPSVVSQMRDKVWFDKD